MIVLSIYNIPLSLPDYTCRKRGIPLPKSMDIRFWKSDIVTLPNTNNCTVIFEHERKLLIVYTTYFVRVRVGGTVVHRFPEIRLEESVAQAWMWSNERNMIHFRILDHRFINVLISNKWMYCLSMLTPELCIHVCMYDNKRCFYQC